MHVQLFDTELQEHTRRKMFDVSVGTHTVAETLWRLPEVLEALLQTRHWVAKMQLDEAKSGNPEDR
jgi:P2-related tail formation protein